MWLTTLTACYIAHVIPFEEPLVHKLELFNEVCTNIMFSIIYAFAVTETKYHDTIGYFFMAVILSNVCTHLFFLGKDVCKGFYVKCKETKYCGPKAAKIKPNTKKAWGAAA
jgi:hypothetical protein